MPAADEDDRQRGGSLLYRIWQDGLLVDRFEKRRQPDNPQSDIANTNSEPSARA